MSTGGLIKNDGREEKEDGHKRSAVQGNNLCKGEAVKRPACRGQRRFTFANTGDTFRHHVSQREKRGGRRSFKEPTRRRAEWWKSCGGTGLKGEVTKKNDRKKEKKRKAKEKARRKKVIPCQRPNQSSKEIPTSKNAGEGFY